jgi:hypothetical protein
VIASFIDDGMDASFLYDAVALPRPCTNRTRTSARANVVGERARHAPADRLTMTSRAALLAANGSMPTSAGLVVVPSEVARIDAQYDRITNALHLVARYVDPPGAKEVLFGSHDAAGVAAKFDAKRLHSPLISVDHEFVDAAYDASRSVDYGTLCQFIQIQLHGSPPALNRCMGRAIHRRACRWRGPGSLVRFLDVEHHLRPSAA